jgi:hypothetical protein
MHSPAGSEGRSPVLYHLHIPKTAGTTLYALLETRFPREKVCPVRLSSLDILRMPREQLAGFDLLGGHWEFGYHLPAILGRPVRAVTLLREPRALVLSLYKQVMQQPLDPIRPYVDANCPTLETFLSDPVMSKYVADTQTRFLAVAERRFTPAVVEKIRAAEPAELNNIVRDANASDPPVSVYEMLHRARRRLAECEVVGLVERFDETAARIGAVFGLPSGAPPKQRNVSSMKFREEELSPRVLHRLDELTALDQILYREVSARFEREVAQPATSRRAA